MRIFKILHGKYHHRNLNKKKKNRRKSNNKLNNRLIVKSRSLTIIGIVMKTKAHLSYLLRKEEVHNKKNYNNNNNRISKNKYNNKSKEKKLKRSQCKIRKRIKMMNHLKKSGIELLS